MRAGPASELGDGGRLLVEFGRREIMIFRHAGALYAYENVCPHMGGPVCRGKLASVVEAHLAHDGEIVHSFSSSETDLVCPWHGFSFDITTGRSRIDARYRLTPFPVHERAGEVYVEIE
jgi:nitrite reductase/ring-hydroxylating ferredoxin subunit